MQTTDEFLTYTVALAILSGCLFSSSTAQAQEIMLDRPEPAQSSTAAGTTIANSISSSGPRVAFVSDADNLVPNDHNQGKLDVFIRNLETGETTLVSVNASGEGTGNGDSNYPLISSDARYVVFESNAGDLVENDANNAPDVFIRDLANNTTTLISSTPGEGDSSSESQLLAATSDAKYVAFKKRDVTLDRVEEHLPGWKLYVYQREESTTTLITQKANDGGAASLFWSRPIAVSSEAAILAFFSPSPDLSGQPLPAELEGLNLPHLYVKNLVSSEIRRIDSQQYIPEIPTEDLPSVDIPSICLSANGENLVLSIAEQGMNPYWINYDLNDESIVKINSEDVLPDSLTLTIPPEVPADFFLNLQESFVDDPEFIDGLSGDPIRIGTAILSADGQKVLLDDQLYDRNTREWKSILPESAGIDEEFPLFGALADPDLNYILFHSQNSSLASGDGNQSVDAFLYDTADDSIQPISLRHPDSVPSVRNGLRVSWTDVSPTDVVQYKNDLSRESWTNLKAEITSEDSSGSVVDFSASLFTRRFYRVLRGN